MCHRLWFRGPFHWPLLLLPHLQVRTPCFTVQPLWKTQGSVSDDGDGIPDVIATDGGNTFLIFPGKGDGTFLAPTSLLEGLTTPPGTTPQPSSPTSMATVSMISLPPSMPRTPPRFSCTTLRLLFQRCRQPLTSPAPRHTLTSRRVFRSHSPLQKQPPAASPPPPTTAPFSATRLQ